MTNRHKRSAAQGPTQALFVRIPAEHARRLDRAAFELRRPKQALVSELVQRYVDPDDAASLAALAGRPELAPRGGARVHEAAPAGFAGAEAGRRRVTVETLEPDTLIVGHHSFRPREPQRASTAVAEVLSSEHAAQLLQVAVEVVEQLAEAGELPGRRLAGEWRFSRAALLGWLAHAPLAGARGVKDDDR